MLSEELNFSRKLSLHKPGVTPGAELPEEIISATPSLKLCFASEIRERQPEIIPPIISAIVIVKLKKIVLDKRVPFAGAE